MRAHSRKAALAYGPNPWQQLHWDWRAAANFVGGGAGCGLIVFSVMSGVQGLARAGLLLLGLLFVGAGLFCVWVEIGRPWRALNVFFNPRTSWMTREAGVAMGLFPCTLASAFGVTGFGPLALLLALAFVYCQGRILRAARGIPAWRDPLVPALIVATSLAEGGGLFVALSALTRSTTSVALVVFGLLVLVRVVLWVAYRRRLLKSATEAANRALDKAGRVLQMAGTLLPVVVVLAFAEGLMPTTAQPSALMAPLVALAGLAALLSGSWLKFVLVTRAGHNQGFALAQLPVRGVPRRPPDGLNNDRSLPQHPAGR